MRGGTLRLATPVDPVVPFTAPEPDATALDPTFAYEWMSWELLRCCLTRTLLSYNGRPAQEGGSEVRPDLATRLPDVSPDGLTWTFDLRQGLRYAPPLEDIEITALDVVRALERTARLSGAPGLPIYRGYAFYYSSISGFDAYAAGTADSISGLETPDNHTLVIRLTRAQGDLGYRLSLPAAAPIPPRPGDPNAQFGVAAGHDDGYGPFLVSSGPYMFEGSGDLDPSLAPEAQQPPAGFKPGLWLNFVRNPSWDPGSDPLRAALSDRIELTVASTLAESHDLVEGGQADMVITFLPPPQAPPDLVALYQRDPALGRVDTRPRDLVLAMMMNVAAPPFDDVHVRRAVQYLVDKQQVIDRQGGALTGQIATHIAPDGIEGYLLAGYDPFATPGGHGSIALAREEMAQSDYDQDGDGMCDAEACQAIVALEPQLPLPRQPIASQIETALEQIGIDLQPESVDLGTYFTRLVDPSEHIAAGIGAPIGKDFPNASSLFPFLFHSSGIGGSNPTLLGASPEQLAGWGYSASSVPSVDDRIDQCLSLVGEAQTECWATLDQYLMENVAAFVPLVVDLHVQIIPARIVAYSFDPRTSPRLIELPCPGSTDDEALIR
jgi:peptide/nickel transport system substrate-binding protein